jgi:hypothetical protein
MKDILLQAQQDAASKKNVTKPVSRR